MSQVKIQGVDSIKFDDSEDSGSLSNLAMGKDVRSKKAKYAFFFQTVMPLMFGVFFLLFGLIVPHFTVISLVVSGYCFYLWSNKRGKFLAKQKGLFDEPKYLRYTKAASEIDYAPKEVLKEVKKAAPGVGKGVFFLGHEISTSQEIHAEDGKFRTHLIIFGTTGSGKTETILSLCTNFLTQASGFILCDGKGDTLLFAKCFALCRAFGRTDDLYLLNFMDEGISSDVKRIENITNSFNFLVDSSAAEANEIIGGLLPSDGNGGSGMWEGRATAAINALNQAIFYLKDNGYLEIDPDTYRAYFALDQFVELARNEAIPKEKRGGLWSILNSINYKPPTDQDPNPKQNPATEEQFQYISMQFTSTFNMLAEEYSHITVSQVPDISITDVVLRRRILLILLPSLAKSEQSVRNLGRIIIAMTRNVSSKAIGSNIEGDYKKTIESKPTAAISSFGLIFDEFGSYATKGASTLPAQVRSLNMVCVFAGQDYEAFRKGDDIEAATIYANCTLKLCMKLECGVTYQKFTESAGEKYIMVQESYETKETMFGRKHIPAESARVEKRPVLDLKDLKEQSNGMATLIYGASVHRLASFYADPMMPAKARLNHFVEVRKPSFPQVQSMREGVSKLYDLMRERLDDDWERLESKKYSFVMQFTGFPTEVVKTYSEMDVYIKKNPQSPVPNETELTVFALSVFAKKIDIVDHNISNALKKSLGYEEEEYDDEELLSTASSSDISFAPDIDQSPILTREESEINESVEVEEKIVDELGVDPEIFDKIELAIRDKKKRLEVAKKESFDSLEEINLSAFDTQKRIQSLEELLMKREGRSDFEAEKLADLTANNLVVDMGLKTNVAIVSEPEKKTKSPSGSSSDVMNVISKIVSEVN